MSSRSSYDRYSSSGKSSEREPASNQLPDYLDHILEKNPSDDPSEDSEDPSRTTTTTSGNPMGYTEASLTVGHHGPLLFQDLYIFNELGHFSRERIPERVVHAKGAAAFGHFELTHDHVQKYTAAKIFHGEVGGPPTKVAVRFSQVFGERGFADTVRDVRGFAVRMYTEEGLWDLVGNNTPIFFIRDGILFPSFIHVIKRNPVGPMGHSKIFSHLYCGHGADWEVTNLRDWDMFWDFCSLRPETVHQILVQFSDRGIPDSYRHMHGYGSHTYGLVNKKGQFFYCKFHWICGQKIQNLGSKEAEKIAGQDPDHLTRDLYNAIAKGDYPFWDLKMQVLSPEEVHALKYHPFDLTKVWLHADAPLIPVGRLTLTKNPQNYHAEVEQLGFDPANLIPGIEPSPDRMLQARLLLYGDTHRYRLGVNHEQIPVNSPFEKVHTYTRDGKFAIDNQGGAPNYHPNSFGGPKYSHRAKNLTPLLPIHGDGGRYDNGDDDNFTQARLLYVRVLKDDEKDRLVENLAQSLILTTEVLQKRSVENLFKKVDLGLGVKVEERVQEIVRNKKKKGGSAKSVN